MTLLAAMTMANTLCQTFATHPVQAVLVVAVIGLIVFDDWRSARRT